MSQNIQTLTPANKIKEVKDLFKIYNIHHIPIMVDNIMTGLISDTDLKATDQNDESEIRVH